MADACLTAIGVETSAAAVAGLYADVLDGWLVDDADGDSLHEVEALGVRAAARPLLMLDPAATRSIAAAALGMALDIAG
jgi:LPPG:FO 2-phospho-L-lactate transferase